MSRTITATYRDPADLVWLETARRLGMAVVRSADVYASWDGAGTLTLSDDAGFDPDDSLAQLVFHEICHALVEGPANFTRPDWGLDNLTDRDRWREDASHRLQAALAERYGLREVLAPTTDFRPYWDALPADPLADGDDPAIAPAREAWDRARHGPWAGPVDKALGATARIAAAAGPFVPPDSLWAKARPLHPAGFPRRAGGETCGGCAWRGREGRQTGRCVAAATGDDPGPGVPPEEGACDRFEPAFGEEACARCGACCREGFDLVPLARREALVQLRPDLVAGDRHGLHLPRPGGRCVLLEGDAASPDGYRCAVYADRPRSCRRFAVAGPSCLLARRRVGMSRKGDPVGPG